MKRVISLVLVLMMALSLIGCGAKELTHDEKVAIYNEIKNEMEASKNEVRTESVIDNMGLQSEYSSTDNSSRKESKYDLVVEDCKMMVYDEHTFSIKMKVRNNTSEPIQRLRVGFHALDKNGDSIYSHDPLYTEDIEPGQANWIGNWWTQSLDEDINIEDIVAFGFPNYKVLEESPVEYIENKVYVSYPFKDYYVANVSDISVIYK